MNLRTIVRYSVVALGLAVVAPASAATIAYETLAGTPGNQLDFHGVLGMNFVVNSTISVLALGAFDDMGDGISGANTVLTTELWSRSGSVGTTILASASFSAASAGDLFGSSRFKDLASEIMLAPGEYAIVSYGYGGDDPNGNKGSSSGGTWFTNDGNGALSFVGRSQFGGTSGASIGITIDHGPADRYAAGTFSFVSAVSAVPLPAALPLLAGGLVLLGLAGGRRRMRTAP